MRSAIRFDKVPAGKLLFEEGADWNTIILRLEVSALTAAGVDAAHCSGDRAFGFTPQSALFVTTTASMSSPGP